MNADHVDDKPHAKEPSVLQRLAAEALGTFVVTAAAASVDILYHSGHEVDYVSRWLARGFATAIVIYAFSETSGAHVDPAVTLGFVLRGTFPARLVFGYWAAQLSGSFAAVGLLIGLFGLPAIALGASRPGADFNSVEAVLCEIVLTFVLMLTILMTATAKAEVGKQAAIAVGFAVAACGLVAGPISGASMNPARSIAPQLLAGLQSFSWIYAVGPFAGAALAVAVVRFVAGPPRHQEQAAAEGDENVSQHSASESLAGGDLGQSESEEDQP